VPGLVSHGVSGLLYDAFSVDALRVCLQQLVNDRAFADTLSRGVPGVKSIETDAREWDARYRQVTTPASRDLAATTP
jgi:hypothetical protein